MLLASTFGMIAMYSGVNCNFCEFMALGSLNIYVTSQAYNIKALLISQELLPTYKGTVISGSLGDTTCGCLYILTV